MASLGVAMGMGGGGLVLGCGGAAGDAVAPEAPSGAQALGDVACQPGIGYREPLVVDWGASQRADLEVAMKEGVAVLHYSCDEIRLLKQCRLPGSYAFTSVTPKQEVVQIASRDELFTNMPLGFLQLQGSVGSGSSIDLAIAMVGKRGTPKREAYRDELEGLCDGATHFVSAALVGAFAMKQGSAGDVQAAASIFDTTAGGSSSSSKSVDRRDGDIDACQGAASDSAEPPSNCSAAIRLELVPIGEATPTAPPPPPPPDRPEPIANPCPEGFVLAAGLCKEASTSAPHLCKESDPADCAAQCDAGHAPSCVRLGHQLTFAKSYGLSIEPDPSAGRERYQQACDLHDAEGCFMTEQYGLACEMGHAKGCKREAEALITQGDLAYADKVSDPGRYENLLRRACTLGELPACGHIGSALLDGKVVKKNVDEGLRLLEFACENGENNICRSLGSMLTQSARAKKDPRLGTHASVQRDVERGLKAWEAGCGIPHFGAWMCVLAAEVYAEGQGVAKDVARAQSLWDRGCTDGANGKAVLCKQVARP